MFLSCWSVKGGSGASVTVASMGLVNAGTTSAPEGVLLVDAAGDLPLVLGLVGDDSPGLAEWIAAGDEVPADGLARVEREVLPGLDLLPRGSGPLVHTDRVDLLLAVLAADPRQVIIDCGTVDPDHPQAVAAALARAATYSLLVIRPCYVAVRRALRSVLQPSRLVVVADRTRALDAQDLVDVLGVPLHAELAVEPEVARAVDAGLLVSRVPGSLRRRLQDAS